ncbi:hypothetical protein D9756_009632 [Leucocoprinus leucothites]|uniref:Uncharacterized protein n=1 Tax=Leucocoprinus leucothites TaxID=201217 RepID=A0A8H5CV52_9AGAR|nr:hypothetical protein D9756_009632 [Leucoagaricus leucothites]
MLLSLPASKCLLIEVHPLVPGRPNIFRNPVPGRPTCTNFPLIRASNVGGTTPPTRQVRGTVQPQTLKRVQQQYRKNDPADLIRVVYVRSGDVPQDDSPADGGEVGVELHAPLMLAGGAAGLSIIILWAGDVKLPLKKLMQELETQVGYQE